MWLLANGLLEVKYYQINTFINKTITDVTVFVCSYIISHDCIESSQCNRGLRMQGNNMEDVNRLQLQLHAERTETWRTKSETPGCKCSCQKHDGIQWYDHEFSSMLCYTDLWQHFGLYVCVCVCVCVSCQWTLWDLISQYMYFSNQHGETFELWHELHVWCLSI